MRKFISDSKSSIHLPEKASWGHSPFSGYDQIVKDQLVIVFTTKNAEFFEYSVHERVQIEQSNLIVTRAL